MDVTTPGGAGARGFDPARVFDPVAHEYQMVRPTYPRKLYDVLDRLVGGLAGRRVVDLGAGTGIASAALVERRARVVAVEPGQAMVRALRSAHPMIPAAAGRAESLPLRSSSVDVITCAQAWHWVELPTAGLECRRVLRSGGYLALWWNVSDSGATWLAEVRERTGLRPYGLGAHHDDRESLAGSDGFASVRYEDVAWQWVVPVDQWVRVAGTRSAIARLGAAGRLLLASITEVLWRRFPEGYVTEPFTCHLALAST